MHMIIVQTCHIISCPAQAEQQIREQVRYLTNHIHSEFSDVSGIGCFEGTFSLQMRGGSPPYQALSKRVAYILQEPLKKELKRLHRQQIIVPLGVN